MFKDLGVAPLLLRKGNSERLALAGTGREALSERKNGFLSGLTLVVALVLETWLYELPTAIHGRTDITVFLCYKEVLTAIRGPRGWTDITFLCYQEIPSAIYGPRGWTDITVFWCYQEMPSAIHGPRVGLSLLFFVL